MRLRRTRHLGSTNGGVGRREERRRARLAEAGTAGEEATIGIGIRWTIAFLIGLATVTAAGIGWRTAQIGSTAAYDDRQSIADTVRVQQAAVERAVEVASEAREYVRYRADYATAAALDHQAAALAAAGAGQLAGVSRGEAAALREGATRRAAEAGVFGNFTIGTDLLQPTRRPRPFDYRQRAKALAAEQSAALDSPAVLAPDRWARGASGIRARMNRLTRWAFLVVVAILLYTAAEVSKRRYPTYLLVAGGIGFYLAGLAAGLSNGFF
jgi:hypothetical protein